MVNIPFPFPMYRKSQGFHIIWFELFKLFPVSIKGKRSFETCNDNINYYNIDDNINLIDFTFCCKNTSK